MRQAIGFSGSSVGGQREDGALSDEVRRGFVLIQLCEDWSERLARVQFLRASDPGVHVHHELCVFSKERHLTFRIASIGAVRIDLDEFPNSEAIRGFRGGDGDVLAHQLASLID